jgi:ribosomal protein S18 acetylase RimI-like enzyme
VPTPDAITLRLAEPADLPALRDLTWRTTLAEPAYADQARAQPDAIQGPSDAFEQGGVTVAEHAGRLAGYVAVLRHADAPAEIDGLFVEPDLQGRGIGRRLLLNGLEQLISAGADVVTVVASPAAIGVYEACGFRQLGPAPTLFGPAVLMEAALSPKDSAQ